MHTNDAPTAIGRIFDAFPKEGQQFVGPQLAWSLLGVVCQYLLPRTDKEGRFRLEGIVPGLSLELGFVKGRQMLVPQTRREIKSPEAGKTLDLGDVRIKPRR